MNENLEKIVESCNLTAENTDGIISENHGEIRPNDIAPALIRRDDRICAVAMRWGFRQGDGRMVINARSENASERVMFRNLVDKNRCVLPAAGYYEWRDGDHLKHLILPSAAEGFYLAGLYKIDDAGQLRFVVLTRGAYGEHARIHARMPLVLTSAQQVRQWLSGALSLETPENFAADDLSIQPLGPEQLSMDFGDQSEA